MFGRLRISHKLPLIVAVAAALSVFSVTMTSYYIASDELHMDASAKLRALVDGRRAALDDYLQSVNQDILTVSTSPTAAAALEEFSKGWRTLDEKPTDYLQKAYIAGNPNKTGEKEKLDFAADGSAYSTTHKRYHPWFRSFLKARGYYDIFLFDKDGNCVYTVFKESDFATNLITGKWKDSGLSEAFRTAMTLDENKLTFVDFQPYAPSNGAPAAFIATPLYENGHKAGVLAFQLPVDRIDSILAFHAGLGDGGEYELVGSDFLMRNNSRLSKEPTLLKRRIESDPVKQALRGETGVGESTKLDGKQVLGAFTPVEFDGTHWALLADIYKSDVEAPVVHLRNMNAIVGLTVLMVVAGIGALFARSISKPLAAAVGALEALGKGDTSVQFKTAATDEIGILGKAIEHFRVGTIRLEEMRQEQQAIEEESKRRLKEEMLALTNELDNQVQTTVSMTSQKSQDTTSIAEKMTALSSSVNKQSQNASTIAETVASNVQSMATAAEELSSTISQINDQVQHSTDVAGSAVTRAEQTNTTVESLSLAANKVGEVVSLISEIAEQTNLLALNATIEAARAGDAGKGFAVVASEVKSLANQTAKATDDIADQMATMQNVTQEAVAAIRDIGNTIKELHEIGTGIAAAVGQQRQATAEIAGNVNQAASGAQDLLKNFREVSELAEQSGDLAERVCEATTTVRNEVEQLRTNLMETLRKSQAGNRREEDRMVLRLPLQSRIVGNAGAAQCSIIDLSATGAQIETDGTVGRGEKIRLSEPSLGEIRCNVVWVRDSHIGLEFEDDEELRARIETMLPVEKAA
jgi:methyl-accepting chemotaxis protein